MITYFIAGLCGLFLIGAALYTLLGGFGSTVNIDEAEDRGELAGHTFYTFANPEENDLRIRVETDLGDLQLRAERGEPDRVKNGENVIEEKIGDSDWRIEVNQIARKRLKNSKRRKILQSVLSKGIFLEYDQGNLLLWTDTRYYKTGQGIDQNKLQETIKRVLILGELLKDDPNPGRISALT